MYRCLARICRLALVGILGTFVLMVDGCAHKELPKTYPVSGKIVRTDGQPLAGGILEFRPTADANLTTVGTLAADGSFALSTIVGNEKIAGATAGEYQVTVLPTSSHRSQAGIVLAEKYVVKPDADNYFLIQVDPALIRQ